MKTQVIRGELIEQLREWVELNPLRRARAQHNISYMVTAGLIGVTVHAVKLWEWGTTVPTRSHLEAIARLFPELGTPSDVIQQWSEWIGERPAV